MPEIKAEVYMTKNGNKPLEEFLETLDPKMQVKILDAIKHLKMFDKDLRMPYSKYLEDGIFELRAIQSSNIGRVLFFFFDGNKAILTNGFIK